MATFSVRCFGISLDGYGAGPNQDPQHPLGVGGPEIMSWLMATRSWQRMQGHEAGETGIDDSYAARGTDSVGAWVMGRNMFGPVRGPWPDETWRGWWGENPPFHVPVFVLTHHARTPLEMDGGTTFHFVTDGIRSALDRAREAAGSREVRLGGGVATIRQYLQARLVEELHLALRPVLLGSGENLFAGLDLRTLGYECVESVAGEHATHVTLRLK